MTTVYGLKAIKMAGGDETPRFEAKITENGKVIATVYNEGCGGSNGYQFQTGSYAPPKEFESFIKQWGIEHKRDFEIMDSWVYTKLDEYENRKRLLRLSKTKTLFRLRGDEEGVWQVIKHPYHPKIEQVLKEKYGDKLETIFVK